MITNLSWQVLVSMRLKILGTLSPSLNDGTGNLVRVLLLFMNFAQDTFSIFECILYSILFSVTLRIPVLSNKVTICFISVLFVVGAAKQLSMAVPFAM
jgi:hypothetical protein